MTSCYCNVRVKLVCQTSILKCRITACLSWLFLSEWLKNIQKNKTIWHTGDWTHVHWARSSLGVTHPSLTGRCELGFVHWCDRLLIVLLGYFTFPQFWFMPETLTAETETWVVQPGDRDQDIDQSVWYEPEMTPYCITKPLETETTSQLIHVYLI